MIIYTTFQFQFMALAIDAVDWRGPSNKMRRKLRPKVTMVMLY